MKKFLRVYLTIMMACTMMQSVVFADTSAEKISAMIPKILNAIAFAGYAVALGMLIYIGAKYTLAAANEKADLKQGVVNYLIGIVVIVSASAIANIVSAIAVGGNAGKDASGLAGAIIEAATNAAK